MGAKLESTTFAANSHRKGPTFGKVRGNGGDQGLWDKLYAGRGSRRLAEA